MNKYIPIIPAMSQPCGPKNKHIPIMIHRMSGGIKASRLNEMILKQ
jgi:hypothetical protein